MIDKKHLNRLILAKDFLKHAKGHIVQSDNINSSIAILSIDNTFEYLVKTLASFYKIDYGHEESLKYIYIKVSRYLESISTNRVGLPMFSKYEPLRVIRNHIQHEKPIMFSDVEEFYDLIEKFFKSQIQILFNLNYDDIDIVYLIKSEEFQILIKNACTEWTKDKMNAMSLLRDAFDNSKRDYIHKLYAWEFVNIYTLSTRTNIQYEVRNMLIQNVESTLFLSIGIDLIQLNAYKEIIDYIPGEYRSEYHGGSAMRDGEEFTYDQFVFVKNFVINSILKMQEKREVNEISYMHKKAHSDFPKINEKKWTLNDNEIILDERSFISVGLRENETIYGFEINENKIIFFNSIKTDDILLENHYIKESEEFIKSSESKVKVNGIKIEILTHNPQIWRVSIALEDTKEDNNFHPETVPNEITSGT